MSRLGTRVTARATSIATLLALSLALVAFVSPAGGAPPRQSHAGDVSGPAMGIIPDTTSSVPATRHLRPAPAVPGIACPDASCNMTYHGGSLMLGPHTTHVVYWEPPGFSVTANYHTLIERYLTDVAADSGRATNVYAVDTQYKDSGMNAIQYSQTFGGTSTDTNPFPATVSGCFTTDGTLTVPNCLTQTQEQNELDSFIQANTLPRGLNNIYFLVLPNNVETCVDDFSDCGNVLNISPRYCAYHSFFNISSHGETLWANEPYIGFADNHCNSGSTADRPNGDVTDHELNTLSHEHNETITDPDNGGWFDTNGTGENGDKCNFNFGTPIASNTNGNYDQLINHNPYEIQQEWDNSITGCSLSFGAVDPTAAFTSLPASPVAADPVSFDGTTSHSNNTGGYIIDYQWNFGDSGTGSGASPSHTYATAGTYTVSLTVKDDVGKTNTVTHSVVVGLRPTTTTYMGATSGDYHDGVTLKAELDDTETGNPLSSQTISFTLGSQSCSGVTNGLGIASCSLTTLTQVPGAYSAVASYAGDGTVYDASSGSAAFTITKEETTVAYTGPTVILAGASTLTVTGTLVEDGANDSDGDPGSAAPSPAGQLVTFTLGTQSCNAFATATGALSCTIPSVSGSLGAKTITASFTGDAYYVGSSATQNVVVFAFPSRGAFVLGNQTVATATPLTTLTWWGANWATLNGVSGGQSVQSFKGFADSVSTLPTTSPANSCSPTFSTAPGNSSSPPAGIPSYMGVIVAHSTLKSGSTISGLWAKVVVVKTNPGYDTNPGHPGTGTLVATFCG